MVRKDIIFLQTEIVRRDFCKLIIFLENPISTDLKYRSCSNKLSWKLYVIRTDPLTISIITKWFHVVDVLSISVKYPNLPTPLCIRIQHSGKVFCWVVGLNCSVRTHKHTIPRPQSRGPAKLLVEAAMSLILDLFSLWSCQFQVPRTPFIIGKSSSGSLAHPAI